VNIPEGETFKIMGKDGKEYEYKIAQRLEEGKGMLDQGVAFNLADLQQILNKEGEINKIEALGCVCHDGRIKNARSQVQSIFPDLEVAEVSSIANARESQRQMMNKYGSFIIPFILIVSMLISGLLFYANVTGRKYEIGIMKAMGKSNSHILFIVLLKAFLLGFIGSVAGFFAGSVIAEYFGKEIFLFTAESINPLWSLLGYSLIIFPVLWMLSSWIPALSATQIDAAKTLSQE